MELPSLDIRSLGPCTIPSPIDAHLPVEQRKSNFVSDRQRVLLDDSLDGVLDRVQRGLELPSIELAGPREHVFFQPEGTSCAIVTCGGLCPGLNDVIRGIVMELTFCYGVRNIYGIPFGYEGFISRYGHDVRNLNPARVENIHMMGGSVLGVSRGEQNVSEIVDSLVRMSINILFVIGGDGTLRGSLAIADEVARRDLPISVIGIPKTIDNDIMFIDKSFGFETAIAAAVESIAAAHTEARGQFNGIGLVKLMGRHSGFIACSAALANNDANYVLIPEVPFALEGEHGLLKTLERRLAVRNHAVIVVAEGAGQDLMEGEVGTDASGNVRLKDIGYFLKERIVEHFQTIGKPVELKYIDPSYMIRSIPASSQDSFYCLRLAQHAVHAGMAGKTAMVVGRWHGHYVNLPTELTTSGRKRVDPTGDLWTSVLESTGQPVRMM